jgi:hypothetical protein
MELLFRTAEGKTPLHEILRFHVFEEVSEALYFVLLLGFNKDARFVQDVFVREDGYSDRKSVV